MNEYGKIPPQAIDIETAVLGAILLEPDCLDSIQDLISERIFYKDIHQGIFKAIQGMYRENKQIDLLTLSERLRGTEQLEKAGGATYLANLTAGIGSAAHIRYHCSILKQKAVQRELIAYSSEVLKKAYDETMDIADLVSIAGRGLDGLTEWLYAGTGEKSFDDILEQAANELEERVKLAQEGKFTGVPTGIADLNKMTGGWQNGDLIIIAGRPSMGKTAVALQFIRKAAMENIPTLVFSLEMQAVRLVDRMITGEAGIDPERYRNGKIDTEDWQSVEKAISELQGLPVHLDDNAQVTMDYIKARARVKKRKGECKMVVIDYLGLVEADGQNGKSREREVAEISRHCKIIAKELDIPVILLSQLNRSCEARSDKRPMLADLRESGAIEQDADMVIFIHRPMKYDIEEMEINGNTESSKGLGELIISKHRNGRTGTVVFKHNDSLTRIYDYIPESYIPSGNLPRHEQPGPVNDNKDITTNLNFTEPLKQQLQDIYTPF